MKKIKILFLAAICNFSYSQKDSLNKTVDTIKVSQLEDVIVKSKKKTIIKKPDRLIFNLQNTTAFQGLNGLEIMKYVPLIDASEEQLKIVGKNSVGLMIDGKLIQVEIKEYLKKIRSNDIEKIEVITIPPAKYDAEGNSGLINIILKKNKDYGWNGSLENTYNQRTYAGSFPYLELKYKSKKIDLTSSVNYNYERKKYTTNILYDYTLNTRENDGFRIDTYKNLGATLNLNYEISSNLNTGLIYYKDVDYDIKDQYFLTYFKDIQKDISSILDAKSYDYGKYNNQSLNIYSDYKLDENGKKISFNLDYIEKISNKDNSLNSLLYNGNYQILNNNSRALNQSKGSYKLFIGMLDFTLPMKNISFDVGLKSIYINNNSDVKFYDVVNENTILNANSSNEFRYDEYINAIYITASKKIGNKIEINGGLRFEKTHLIGDQVTLNQINKSQYNNLFPSVYINYNPKENQSYNLSYSRRINRPNLNEINPFRWYSDNYSYSVGNPNILPSFIHNIEFTYMYNNNFSTSLYYSKTNDVIGWITTSIPNSLSIIETVKNYLNSDALGITITYNLKVKKYNNFLTLNSYYNYSKSLFSELTIPYYEGYGYSVSSRNSYKISNKSTFTLDYSHKFPSIIDLIKTKNSSYFNLGFRTSFFNENLNVSFSFNDIFKQSRSRSTGYYKNFIANYNFYNDMRYFGVTLNYNFGNAFLKNNNKSNYVEEQNRLLQ